MTGFRVLALAVLTLAVLSGPSLAQEERCPALEGTAHVVPSPETVEGAVSHTYKTADGTDLRLHVFQPSDAPPAVGRPAVVIFFGGGWMNGVVDQMAPQAAYIAERGAIAILVDYRTYCRDGADVSAEVSDARDAMRWVRSHARSLGVDPHKIAASGGSSGAHLALSTAAFAETDRDGVSSRPDLLVLFYPCVDLTSEAEMEYSGAAIAEAGEALSPLLHVRPGLPPIYIFQGTEDPLYDANVEYCDAVRATGGACEWVQYEGAAHGFFNRGAPASQDWYDTALRGMDAALTAETYLSPHS